MSELSTGQARVFEFLIAYQEREGFCPSREEIRRHFGYRSPNAVTSHLQALARKGYVGWSPGRARAIRILRNRPSPDADVTDASIPLLGQIAAGRPILAQENVEDTLSVPAGFLGAGTHFALNVKGDSMKDAGIDDGDIALIRCDPELAEGRIMAVVIDDEATLKRVFKSPDGLVLRSENPAYEDMVQRLGEGVSVRMAGRLAGLLKRWR